MRKMNFVVVTSFMPMVAVNAFYVELTLFLALKVVGVDSQEILRCAILFAGICLTSMGLGVLLERNRAEFCDDEPAELPPLDEMFLDNSDVVIAFSNMIIYISSGIVEQLRWLGVMAPFCLAEVVILFERLEGGLDAHFIESVMGNLLIFWSVVRFGNLGIKYSRTLKCVERSM